MRWAQVALWIAILFLVDASDARHARAGGRSCCCSRRRSFVRSAIEYRVDVLGNLGFIAALVVARCARRWIAFGALMSLAVLANMRLAPLVIFTAAVMLFWRRRSAGGSTRARCGCSSASPRSRSRSSRWLMLTQRVAAVPRRRSSATTPPRRDLLEVNTLRRPAARAGLAARSRGDRALGRGHRRLRARAARVRRPGERRSSRSSSSRRSLTIAIDGSAVRVSLPEHVPADGAARGDRAGARASAGSGSRSRSRRSRWSSTCCRSRRRRSASRCAIRTSSCARSTAARAPDDASSTAPATRCAASPRTATGSCRTGSASSRRRGTGRAVRHRREPARGRDLQPAHAALVRDLPAAPPRTRCGTTCPLTRDLWLPGMTATLQPRRALSLDRAAPRDATRSGRASRWCATRGSRKPLEYASVQGPLAARYAIPLEQLPPARVAWTRRRRRSSRTRRSS